MSGPFKAEASEIRALADFIEGLGDLTAKTGVSAFAYGPGCVELPSGSIIQLRVVVEDETTRYVIDDRVGD